MSNPAFISVKEIDSAGFDGAAMQGANAPPVPDTSLNVPMPAQQANPWQPEAATLMATKQVRVCVFVKDRECVCVFIRAFILYLSLTNHSLTHSLNSLTGRLPPQ
jgi:hypothetical protein